MENKMFRAIRKKKNQISFETAKKLLHSAKRGILAVNGDDGYPYAIPINYLYDEGNQKIIFHGAKAGHKVDSLKKSDKVCFTVLGNETIKDEVWAPYLQSVVVFGKCRLVDNKDDIIRLIKKFAIKYYPSEDMVNKELTSSAMGVQIFEIAIEHISGKEVQER
jgi:nitroimidazol reductase NimA-like FMN-containing flavoprotein (pyridoxamine 5'-phosphate oxidase superfamily)